MRDALKYSTTSNTDDIDRVGTTSRGHPPFAANNATVGMPNLRREKTSTPSESLSESSCLKLHEAWRNEMMEATHRRVRRQPGHFLKVLLCGIFEWLRSTPVLKAGYRSLTSNARPDRKLKRTLRGFHGLYRGSGHRGWVQRCPEKFSSHLNAAMQTNYALATRWDGRWVVLPRFLNSNQHELVITKVNVAQVREKFEGDF